MEASPDEVVSFWREWGTSGQYESDFTPDKCLEVLKHKPVQNRSGFTVGKRLQLILVGPLKECVGSMSNCFDLNVYFNKHTSGSIVLTDLQLEAQGPKVSICLFMSPTLMVSSKFYFE